MAEFPSKVTTETGASSAQTSQQGSNNLRGLATEVVVRMDVSFIKSIPAILMIVEIVMGLLHWTLIAAGPYTILPAYGWVMFVAVTLWILTTTLFFIIVCGVQQKITFVPWLTTMVAYNSVATVLYLTAFLANAVSVTPFLWTYYYGHFAAAAFFGAVVTVAYFGSAFFFFLEWRGDGGNAATTTVPT